MSQIDLQQIIGLATEAFGLANDAAALANAKARFMGKDSELTAAMKAMGKQTPRSARRNGQTNQ